MIDSGDRRPREERLGNLAQEQEALEEFAKKWRELDNMAFNSLTKEGAESTDPDVFNALRDQCSRLLPRVKSRLGQTSYYRSQYGRTSQHDFFGFLLAELPHVFSFWDQLTKEMWRSLYYENRARASNRLESALGQLEHEVQEARTGPAWVDPLTDYGESLGVSNIKGFFDAAEERIAEEDFPEATHNCRLALERAVRTLANRVSSQVAKRPFGNGLDVLRDRGVIDHGTRLQLGARDVGLYAWLSEHGSHADDANEPKVACGPAEGRYAWSATRAAIRLLLDAFEAYQRQSEAPEP